VTVINETDNICDRETSISGVYADAVRLDQHPKNDRSLNESMLCLKSFHSAIPSKPSSCGF
jgi:hypothetical protein